MSLVPDGGDVRVEGSRSFWLTTFIALAAGVAISNNYTLQPALPAVAQTFDVPLTRMGLVAGSLQAGYMIGIVLLVPLGDRIAPAKIVGCQFALLAGALILAGCSPSLSMLAAAGCMIGMMATNAVHLATIAFRLAAPASRGRAVGTVGTGVSAGILLSRFVGGLISQAAGWRALLILSGGVCIVLAVLAQRLLPRETPHGKGSYLRLLASLPSLLYRYRLLREGVIVGACWFFVFSMLWVTLVLAVARPPLSLSTAQAGMFSFAGVLGLFATRAAGRGADRFGYRPLIAWGFVLVLAGVALMLAAPASIPVMALGLVLFDVGCFSAQVANQTRLLAIDADARSRIYSVYMFVYYGAGALGSVLGPPMLERFGWRQVCQMALLISAIGLAVTFARHRAHSQRRHPENGHHAVISATNAEAD
jgi:predicted MFS family arabinose efflux permease